MLDQASETIATKLNLQHSDIKELMDAAPYVDTIAADKKLINQLLHKDEVEKLFDTNPEIKPSFVSIKTYRKNAPTYSTTHSFALVSVSDEITTPAPASYNQESNSPEKVVKYLQKAAQDSSISAIILRVDSPGGTVTGAEAIWYEVNRIANTLKKPIIVSMGTLAASAGYQIAAPATKIVANPGTITGSIGVATGKLAIKEAAAEFGINLRQIKTAKHAGMWSMAEEFSSEEWANIQKDLDHYYDIFLKKVADGRHLSLEKTRTIAKGQVWTGKQAKEIGLVDELGGFLKALSVAKQLVNIPEESHVEIVMMEEPSFIGSFFDDFFGGVELISNLNQQVKTMMQGQTAVESKLGFIPH
jgi:protease-4